MSNSEQVFTLSPQGVMAVMMVLNKALMYAESEGGMRAKEEIHIPTMLQNIQWSNTPQGLMALNPPTIDVGEVEAFEEHDVPDFDELVDDLLED